MSSLSENKYPFQKLQLKWKKPRLYLLILYNILIPGMLGLERILSSKTDLWKSSKVGLLAFASIIPIVVFTIFILYCYKVYQEWKEENDVIKPTRLTYFYRASTTSVFSFLLLVIGLTVSYVLIDTNSSAVSITVYTFLGVSFISGLVSTSLMTIYEFCVSFDIFYSKNKEEIIKANLEYANANALKISEDKSVNEDKEEGR